MVVHAPFGGRINKGFGLALRKKFCATFDFELQAAANDDAVRPLPRAPAQLPPRHRAPAPQVGDGPGRSRTGRPGLAHVHLPVALEPEPVAGRPPLPGGRKNPLPIQRMESDDLMAAVFPALAACQENAAAGPGPDPRSRPRPPDPPRLPPRGHGRRRPGEPCSAAGGGPSASTSWSRPSRRSWPTRS
jgi:ATP-dependent Lhr-like helicase